MEDFRNLIKLTYLHPGLHHSGGTICEPVDLPVTKRHLEMIYAHQRLSDKPYMGSVTAPSRAKIRWNYQKFCLVVNLLPIIRS